jgi:hypothetical protein
MIADRVFQTGVGLPLKLLILPLIRPLGVCDSSLESSYSKRQRAEGRRQKAEEKSLTGQGFSIWLCPNHLGDCYRMMGKAFQRSG